MITVPTLVVWCALASPLSCRHPTHSAWTLTSVMLVKPPPTPGHGQPPHSCPGFHIQLWDILVLGHALHPLGLWHLYLSMRHPSYPACVSSSQFLATLCVNTLLTPLEFWLPMPGCFLWGDDFLIHLDLTSYCQATPQPDILLPCSYSDIPCQVAPL